MVKHGIETGKFGFWLTKYMRSKLKYRNYEVFYDHGNNKKYKNVVSTVGFFGEEVKNRNRITHVDVMVANPDKSIELLIEIEERPCSPKKVLGDVMGILMCNRFSVKIEGIHRYYKPKRSTKVFIVGVLPKKGDRIKKIKEIIAPRFVKFKSLNDTIPPNNFIFIFMDKVTDSIKLLKSEIRELFS